MSFVPNNRYRGGLSKSEQDGNVTYMLPLMRAYGWTDESIAAMLGNWQAECRINPNNPQYSEFPNPRYIDGKANYGGFGLPQWTPWSNKIGAYAAAKGIYPDRTNTNPLSDIDLQLEYHNYECINGLPGTGGKTWYSNHGYNYTWSGFTASHDNPYDLAVAYYWQYERSAAMSPGNRGDNALVWYNFIKGIEPRPNKVTNNFIIIAKAAGII